MSDEQIASWRDISVILDRHGKNHGEAARAVMEAFNNTPQPITAETVQRVLEAWEAPEVEAFVGRHRRGGSNLKE